MNVPQCGTSKPATADSFELPSGKSPFPAETRVEICWTEEFLSVKFDAQEDKFLKNDIKGDSALFNQEVVEMYIGDKKDLN